MIYLIGGASRSGKTTLARQLRRKLGESRYLSCDTLRTILKDVISKKETLDFDISRESDYIEYYSNHAEHAYNEMRRQSEELQPFIRGFIRSSLLESNEDVVVEGVNLYPDMQYTDEATREVYIYDSSLNQWERILEFESEHSWILNKGLTDAQLQALSQFAAYRSEKIRQLAIENHKKFFDHANHSYAEIQKLALESLVGE